MKCADCLNITGEIYDHLVSNSSPNLRWFCDTCDKVLLDDSHSGQTQQQKQKLNNLISLIGRLVERYETIESKLDSKCSMDEAKQLDSRIKHIEEKLMQYYRELGPRFQSLESQLQSSSTQQISTSLSKVLQY